MEPQSPAQLRRQQPAGDVLEPWPGLVGVGYSHLDGHLLAPWLAKATLLQQVCGGDAAGTLRDRLTAYRDANAAGPWWPDGDVVVVAERNTEIRRIAIERLGWDRFVAEAGLFLVDGPVPDPGNPGNTLTLYAVPPAYGTGEMLLLCTNASPDRDGTVRRFGLHVPAGFGDAVAAAAWTFDLDRRTHEGLERAT